MLAREITRLIFLGNFSNREIAQQVSVSHTTVGKYSSKIKEKGLTKELVNAMTESQFNAIFGNTVKINADQKPLPDFQEWLNKLTDPDNTQRNLWLEYRAKYPDGYSYPQLARKFKKWKKKLLISMQQEHKAGEGIYIDYSGRKIAITDRVTNQIVMAEVFVATLGASQYTYVEASNSQSTPDFLASNANAIHFFDGVPMRLVPDNLKSAVVFAGKKIKINPRYLELAKHYETAIIPARPNHPKDKAVVEVAVKIVQRWILAVLSDRVFYSIREANEAIWELLEVYNNRKFQKLSGSRHSRFIEIDKPALRPIPNGRYEYAEWKYRCRVGENYYVNYDHSFYMVPYQLAHNYLDIKATKDIVEIYDGGVRVASYSRSRQPDQYLKTPQFMYEPHRAMPEYTERQLNAWAQSVGPSTAHAFDKLLYDQNSRTNGLRTCLAIIKLAEHHPLPRIEAAIAKALELKSINKATVEAILRNGREISTSDIPMTSEIDLTQSFKHIRGSDYYQ